MTDHHRIIATQKARIHTLLEEVTYRNDTIDKLRTIVSTQKETVSALTDVIRLQSKRIARLTHKLDQSAPPKRSGDPRHEP